MRRLAPWASCTDYLTIKEERILFPALQPICEFSKGIMHGRFVLDYIGFRLFRKAIITTETSTIPVMIRMTTIKSVLDDS